MAVLNLEKILDTALLDVTADVVMSAGPTAPSPGGFDSAQVIRVDETTTFSFTWTASGALLPWFNASQMKFDVFYELMGPGEAVIAVPTSTTTTLGALTTTLTIAPNQIPDGVYRIVGRMMMLPPVGTTPTKLCGFVDLDIVEYYTV